MSTTRIYLIRHCESLGNISNRFMGHTNVDISERGKEQLELLSERFKDAKIDKVYSSPLKRAYLTAQAANKYLCLSIETDDRLMEINLGDLENIPMSEVVKIDPVNADHWTNNPHLFNCKNGESMQDVYDRAFPALQNIAAKNPGLNIIVASHGCFIRNALCRADGNPLSTVNQTNWCYNTGVNLLEFDENGNCNVVYRNDVTHLPQEMIANMKLVPKISRPDYKG